MADHPYVESGSGFCARCDDMPGEGEHALPSRRRFPPDVNPLLEAMFGYEYEKAHSRSTDE